MYLMEQSGVFSSSTQLSSRFLLAGHTSPVEPGYVPGTGGRCKETNRRPRTADILPVGTVYLSLLLYTV